MLITHHHSIALMNNAMGSHPVRPQNRRVTC